MINADPDLRFMWKRRLAGGRDYIQCCCGQGRRHKWEDGNASEISIQRMCRLHQLDEKLVNSKSRLLLAIYRDVCWSTIGRADAVHEDLVCYCVAN